MKLCPTFFGCVGFSVHHSLLSSTQVFHEKLLASPMIRAMLKMLRLLNMLYTSENATLQAGHSQDRMSCGVVTQVTSCGSFGIDYLDAED
jgi:hypothetical protein